MIQSEKSDWVGPIVAAGLCLLTPLVRPVVSMGVAALVLAGMAIYYWRRTRSWVGAWAALAGAVAVSMAIVYFMARD